MNQKLQTEEKLREEVENSIVCDIMKRLLSSCEVIKNHTWHQNNEIQNIKNYAQLLNDKIKFMQYYQEKHEKEIYELRNSIANLEKKIMQSSIHNHVCR